MAYTKMMDLVRDYTVIDFETTGFNEKKDKIIQIGAVKYRDLKRVGKLDIMVNPGVDIPEKITEITGITDEDVSDGELIEGALIELVKFIGNDVIIAHNAPFDMRFLLKGLQDEVIEYDKFKVTDTLELSREYIKKTKNHKLPTLKVYLGLGYLDSHDALSDCIVAGELYKYCYLKVEKQYREEEDALDLEI